MQSVLLRLANVVALVLVTAICLAFISPVTADDSPTVSILYYESLQLIVQQPSSGNGITGPASINEPNNLEFDAYGRRFKLVNDEAPYFNQYGFEVFTGKLEGLGDSWFRLLRKDGELSGIINDGNETYLIEPVRRIYDALVERPANKGSANIIFRLADTLVPQGLLACDTLETGVDTSIANSTSEVNGQIAFAKLSSELEAASTVDTAGNQPLILEIIGDLFFTAKPGTDAVSRTDDIAALVNVVQGIYDNQIGLEIEVADIKLITPDTDNPFTDTEDGSAFLSELARWRLDNLSGTAITHLVTRRSLTGDSGGNIAGTAYLGSVCNDFTGASLSREIDGLTALIIAHEIGHNLGAPHDGEPPINGAAKFDCESTSITGFIMAPTIASSYDQFSQCSIEKITTVINNASCLAPISNSSTGGGGGGGGSLTVTSLAVLSLLAVLRRLRRRPILN
ncbi:MAG: M12 family metallo-peptidase [Gammaproteobacteria bacterium]|nr:M12 family metallo-peptidase [Gammaproteobacteria bacterium]